VSLRAERSNLCPHTEIASSLTAPRNDSLVSTAPLFIQSFVSRSLENLVFAPLNLAPGESRAIDIPFMPDPAAGARQELILRVKNDKPGRGPCPLLVQAIGYDSSSRATEFVIDRFTPGFEETFPCADPVKSQLPLGFVGGNGQQVGRFLISGNNSPLSCCPLRLYRRCGCRNCTASRYGEFGLSGYALQKAWPIK
jgi:hypothetical protein